MNYKQEKKKLKIECIQNEESKRNIETMWKTKNLAAEEARGNRMIPKETSGNIRSPV